jgi:hypothetical protein
MIGVRFLAEAIFSSSLQRQNSCHQASYSVGTGSCFLEVKRQEREANRSWNYTFTLPHASPWRSTWLTADTTLPYSVVYFDGKTSTSWHWLRRDVVFQPAQRLDLRQSCLNLHHFSVQKVPKPSWQLIVSYAEYWSRKIYIHALLSCLSLVLTREKMLWFDLLFRTAAKSSVLQEP